MSIPLIPSVTATSATPQLFGPGATGAAQGANPAAGGAFEDSLLSLVDDTASSISRSGEMGQQAATGQLRNIHDYMIASAEASTMLEMTVALKNEALRAFQTVMNTPV